uniref:Uncharacterized protein n=1 Tax=Arundo donax TaxID=35708 RepID=A0A0A8Y1C6_ARUDO
MRYGCSKPDEVIATRCCVLLLFSTELDLCARVHLHAP